MKKAPFYRFQEEKTDFFSDWFVLVGNGANAAYYRNNEAGKGEHWQLIRQAYGLQQDHKPVMLNDKSLNEIDRLQLAPEKQRAIKFFQCGALPKGLSNETQTKLLINLAQNCPDLSVVSWTDEGLNETNLTPLFQRIKQGKDSVANSLKAKQKHAKDKEPIKSLPYIEERIESDLEGLFLITPKFEQGEIVSERAERLSDVIRVIGLGVNDEEHFLLLQDEEKPLILPLEDVGEPKGWQFLKRNGLTITSKTRLKAELADYLQLQGKTAKRYTITSKTGWNDDFSAFVMPNGDIIGNTLNPIKYHALDRSSGYDVQGTPLEWRDNVGNLALKNPSMMLAVGVALSAPLLSILELDSYGVHLFEDSTHGKTTTLNLASSIYGKPKEIATSWNATPFALQNIASSRNDLFMPLDEISESTPKAVNQTAYSLFNGQGKAQGHKDGGNREIKKWLIANLSTGETDLESYLKASGLTANSGQFVRLLNIPMRKATEFHSYTDGKAHADAINANAKRFYGAMGREWIKYLASADKAELQGAYSKIKDYRLSLLPDDCEGQIKRVVGDRFAVIHTALFLAADLLGWSDSEINTALTASFNDWISFNGWHSKKETQIIEQVNGFLLANDESGFVLYPFDERQGRINNKLGYKVQDDKQGNHYFLFPIAFDEAIKGQSKELACKVLINAKMLERSKEKGSPYRVRIPKAIDETRQRAYKLYLLQEE